MKDPGEDIWLWWGLARRRDAGQEVTPTRIEIATIFLLFALLINTLWLIVLCIGPLYVLVAGVLSFWTFALLVPAIFAAFCLLIGWLLPPHSYQKTVLPGIVCLAREQGWLKRWDSGIGLFAIVGLMLGAFRISGFSHWPTVIVVCVLVLLSIIGIRCFKPSPLVFRKWQMPMPGWLKIDTADNKPAKDESSRRGKMGEELPQPEDGSNFRGLFEAIGASGDRVQVGVVIDNEKVIKPLRLANVQAKGQLYQIKPLAVVLSQGEPANGVGLSEVDRLCRQLALVARAKRLTRYQFANSILRFVQAAIDYQFDEVSTARILLETFKDYGRFPAETLYDQVGDCECTAILCAALLARSGFMCTLLEVEVAPGEHHMAVGLELTSDLFMTKADDPFSKLVDLTTGIIDDKEGHRYLYGETAVDGPRSLGFGVVPNEWRKTFRVLKFIPIPIPV